MAGFQKSDKGRHKPDSPGLRAPTPFSHYLLRARSVHGETGSSAPNRAANPCKLEGWSAASRTSPGKPTCWPSIPSLLGFNGERPDPVTGHYHLGNGYRPFNPVLMRFNSPDSWSALGKGGVNAYAYCGGDPKGPARRDASLSRTLRRFPGMRHPLLAVASFTIPRRHSLGF